MAFGRPPLDRRALLGATLGAVYALLLLPAPGTTLGVSVLGIAWFLLSMGLLFLTPLAYHAFNTWAILWAVWRGVSYFRDGGVLWQLALDLAFPVAAVLLLSSSPYLEQARAFKGELEAADA